MTTDYIDDLTITLKKTAQGDREAFNALYRATSAKLFGVILRILEDRTLAADILQEV
jgi:RNA polymerase sigma-70 factor (ECF subfamily)